MSFGREGVEHGAGVRAGTISLRYQTRSPRMFTALSALKGQIPVGSTWRVDAYRAHDGVGHYGVWRWDGKTLVGTSGQESGKTWGACYPGRHVVTLAAVASPKANPRVTSYEVFDTTGHVVWTGSAKDATAAMTKFRKESGVGFPNKAVFDGNYGVRKVRKAKNPGTPKRANHWVLPMAAGAGALYGAQKLGLVRAPKGRKNPGVRPGRGPYDVVKFRGKGTDVDRVLSTHSTLGAAQGAHKAIVLQDGKLIPGYLAYGIVDHGHGHKANPGTRASRADAAHKLFGGPRHKVTKRFLKGENVGYADLAVKIVKYGKDQTIIMGTGVPQQAVPTAQIEDISSPEWNKRWDKQFWGPAGKPENLSNPAGRKANPGEVERVVVIFRQYKSGDAKGDVLAVFPGIVADHRGNLQCYEHHGQHGACSTEFIHNDTIPAKAGPELEALRRELRQIGYDVVERKRAGKQPKKLNPRAAGGSAHSRGPWKSMAAIRAAAAANGSPFFKNKPRRGSELEREGTIKGPYNGRFIVVPAEIKLSNGWQKKGLIYRVTDDGQIRHVETLTGAYAHANAVDKAKEMAG